jgi:hypothetical protein
MPQNRPPEELGQALVGQNPEFTRAFVVDVWACLPRPLLAEKRHDQICQLRTGRRFTKEPQNRNTRQDDRRRKISMLPQEDSVRY